MYLHIVSVIEVVSESFDRSMSHFQNLAHVLTTDPEMTVLVHHI